MGKLFEPDISVPIEPNQIWSVRNGAGQLLRRIRILAEYPSPGEEVYWIYEVAAGGIMQRTTGELGRIPEFNLRYVFELEPDGN